MCEPPIFCDPGEHASEFGVYVGASEGGGADDGVWDCRAPTGLENRPRVRQAGRR